eukprot:TRINITY_DN528_c0_g1_i5.p1 TRINITY_DN528_c0_g1~~TRINITY_DN528_c0_g1_i5.p1  ORF type:complete len:320 (+),score=80.84 TRINITY_DN528_c0_g1_i5:572-1531(+)
MRPASTVIIAAFSQSPKFNYKILMVQRSLQSSFMPGVFVFPGGVVETADSDKTWEKLVDQKLSEEDKWKIGGIREVFEETNILIAKPKSTPFESFPLTEMAEWRKKVHQDAKQFPEFCAHYNFVLQPSSLTHWSSWITPIQEKKRFDTKFYLAVLPDIPAHTSHDPLETAAHVWVTPQEALDQHEKGKFGLAPPTWFTLLEFLNLHTLDELNQRAQQRQKGPVPTYTPNINFSSKKDGFITFEGDEHHPLPEDVSTQQQTTIFTPNAQSSQSIPLASSQKLDKKNEGKRNRIIVNGSLKDFTTWRYKYEVFPQIPPSKL